MPSGDSQIAIVAERPTAPNGPVLESGRARKWWTVRMSGNHIFDDLFRLFALRRCSVLAANERVKRCPCLNN